LAVIAHSRLAVLLLAVLLGLAAGVAPTRAVPMEPRHLDALLRLAEPIEDCVGNYDHRIERGGAFHGCFDWHSAVHANLALRLVARLTGQSRYRVVAEQIATPAKLAEDQAMLASGRATRPSLRICWPRWPRSLPRADRSARRA
jgi:CubicO group peptidase (beta-lactamase class C family)